MRYLECRNSILLMLIRYSTGRVGEGGTLQHGHIRFDTTMAKRCQVCSGPLNYFSPCCVKRQCTSKSRPPFERRYVQSHRACSMALVSFVCDTAWVGISMMTNSNSQLQATESGYCCTILCTQKYMSYFLSCWLFLCLSHICDGFFTPQHHHLVI